MTTNNPNTLRQAAHLALRCLDLTELGEHCDAPAIETLCARAVGNKQLPAVAAVCVWPASVAQARRLLPAPIAVAAVINFPSGQLPIEAVAAEVAQVLAAGGQEIDCVLPYRHLLSGDPAHCHQLLARVRQAAGAATLKVILESGELKDPQLIRAACDMALAHGADFLKTSTGKTPVGATLEAVHIMLDAIAQHPRAAQLGFKPSGGLRTVADVLPYFELVTRKLGQPALNPQRFRIGASSLYNDIVKLLGADSQPSAPTVGGSNY